MAEGIKVGTTNVSCVYLGTSAAKCVYVGSTKVRPVIKVTGVSLNKSSITFSAVGQTSQLTATVTPSNADNKNVTWTSSNTSIATVSDTGLVTCVTSGTCTITATTVDGGYTATCNVLIARTIDALIVGGGGGGGQAKQYCAGGGGGAGGAVSISCCQLPVGSYEVIVGAGGAGGDGWVAGGRGYSGCNSRFNGITAYGGGGGGSGCICPGLSGGSGGGGGSTGGSGKTNGGLGRCLQGNGGGQGWGVVGGGGGGYCEAGHISTDSEHGGYGGCGLNSSITGAPYWYASGGSGGGCRGGGCPICGGGEGGGYYYNGSPATTYGSGGGGGGYVATGGAGCQGIFILRYPSSCGYNITGGTKYLCNGYCIHCFTSNGTLTVN